MCRHVSLLYVCRIVRIGVAAETRPPSAGVLTWPSGMATTRIMRFGDSPVTSLRRGGRRRLVHCPMSAQVRHLIQDTLILVSMMMGAGSARLAQYQVMWLAATRGQCGACCPVVVILATGPPEHMTVGHMPPTLNCHALEPRVGQELSAHLAWSFVTATKRYLNIAQARPFRHVSQGRVCGLVSSPLHGDGHLQEARRYSHLQRCRWHATVYSVRGAVLTARPGTGASLPDLQARSTCPMVRR